MTLSRVIIDHGLQAAALRPGAARTALAWLVRRRLKTIADPALRRRLTPTADPLCKRPVFSARYYKVIQRPDTVLVDIGIDEIVRDGVRSRDGQVHELDVRVLATGYRAQAYMRPMRVYGRGGVALDEAWKDGPSAYNTVAVPDFPNMFMLMGPHSPLVGNAIWDSAERQGAYIVQLTSEMRRRHITSCAPTSSARRRWYSEMAGALTGTIWGPGCQSWYIGPNGVALNWPYSRQRWYERLDRVNLSDFELSG